jgi:hypothetical protein
MFAEKSCCRSREFVIPSIARDLLLAFRYWPFAVDLGYVAAADRRGPIGFPLEGLPRSVARTRKGVILRASDEDARRTSTHPQQPPVVRIDNQPG